MSGSSASNSSNRDETAPGRAEPVSSLLPKALETRLAALGMAQKAILSLAIGLLGGGFFVLIGAPLPWMLGALVMTTAAALAGAPLRVPAPLRTLMITILGVMLGAAFSPAVVQDLPRWAGVIVILALFVSLLTVCATAYYRWVAGYDLPTALFAATPGGITEMTLAGEATGGDVRVISLCHATRILMAVGTIPVYFRFVEGVAVPPLPPGGVSLTGIPMGEAALLAACAAIGLPLARRLKLPAAPLTGPMILSALLHGAGASSVAPPVELTAAAQVVIGTALGARYVGFALAKVWPVLVHASITGLFMVAAATLCAWLVAPTTQTSFLALLLALAPGGIAEMGLLAISLGVETAFVSTMHVVRIVLIILAATPVFRAAGLVQARAPSE